MKPIRIVTVVAVTLSLAACPVGLHATETQLPLQSGDYLVTQASPEARHSEHNPTAQSFIFHVTGSGGIQTIARPPAIAAPRGIRALGQGQFVFADVGAIRVMASDGTVRTLYKGAPLILPRDVALDHDGGYVIADFFAKSIFKLTGAGKVATLHRGPPLRFPHGIDVDKEGNYVVADASGSLFRLTPQGAVAVVATGPPLVNVTDVKVDSDGNYIVTDIGFVIDDAGKVDLARSRNPAKLLKISPSGEVSVIARKPRAHFRAVALLPDGSYIVVDMMNAVYRITPDGSINVIYEGPPLRQPGGVAIVP